MATTKKIPSKNVTKKAGVRKTPAKKVATKKVSSKKISPSSKPTLAQTRAAKKNIKKAQATRKGMTHRQHALAQPQGRDRKKPGSTGKGAFYHIEVRPKYEFTSFRVQDVGKKGGIERVAGRRPSGSRATATRLVSKEVAHVTADKKLVIDDAKARTMLKQIRGPIKWLKGDVFTAHPKKNVPEKAKPTPAMKAAQMKNIKKAQAAKARLNKKK